MDLTSGYWPLVMAIIAPVAALVGILLGTVLNGWQTRRSDKLRWERDQHTRLEERRIEAYASFLATMNELVLGHATRPGKVEAKVLTDGTIAFHKVLILGSKPVAEAAGWYFREVYDFIGSGRADTTFDATAQARDKLFAAVKGELGLR